MYRASTSPHPHLPVHTNTLKIQACGTKCGVCLFVVGDTIDAVYCDTMMTLAVTMTLSFNAGEGNRTTTTTKLAALVS